MNARECLVRMQVFMSAPLERTLAEAFECAIRHVENRADRTKLERDVFKLLEEAGLVNFPELVERAIKIATHRENEGQRT